MAEGLAPRRRGGRRSSPRGPRRPRSGRSRRCRRSRRAPGRRARLRIPSASPVSIDSSSVMPRRGDRLAVGDQLVAGADRDDVAGDDLVAEQLDHRAVADDPGPRRDQHRQLVERRLRLQLLADPDVGVDHRDQAEERVGVEPEPEVERRRRPPMIALKRVKTLPATMLEVEREEVSGGGPSLRSRAAASSAREALLALMGGRFPQCLFNRVTDRMALKLGVNLGYWGIGPAGEEALEVVAGGRAARLRVGLGGRVLRLRRRQRARLAGGADRDDQPRRRDPAGAGAAARGGGDGRGDDRQALRRPLPLRLRPVRPAGLRRLVRRPLREALGPDPRVHRSGARDHRPRGPARTPRRALPRCRCPAARARR